MHIVFLAPPDEHELELRWPSTLEPTICELAELLETFAKVTDGQRASGLFIDGRWVDAGVSLRAAGLVEGATVQVRRPGPPSRHAATLAITGGVDAGRRLQLPPGVHSIGRDRDCSVALTSPTVSRAHATLEVSESGQLAITDLGSHNGTRVEGHWVDRAARPAEGCIALGAVHLEQEALTRDQPAMLDAAVATKITAGPRRPWNRPPRVAPPPSVDLPEPPIRAATSSASPRLSWALVLAPLIFAAVAAMFLGPMFALLALLSPVMALATWFEGRGRVGSERRKDARRFQVALDAYKPALARAAMAEVERRRQVLPHPAEIVRRATVPSRRLWERRRTDPDFLLLRIGTGGIGWPGPLPSGAEPEVSALLDQLRLDDAPVAVDLRQGPIGVVGDLRAARSLAASLVAQVAVLHGPGDATIVAALEAESTDWWKWLGWLPHCTDPDRGESARWVLVGSSELEALQPLIAGSSAEGPATVLLVDGAELLAPRGSPARTLLRRGHAGVTGIVIATSADRLPSWCTTIVDVDADGVATVLRPQCGAVTPGLLVAGLDGAAARTCARALARWEDPDAPSFTAGLPDSISLLEVLDRPDLDTESVAARWRTAAAAPTLRAVLGADAEGALDVDLVSDGPHALVGGTTGSGKSELLRTLVASLALGTGPEELSMVLVDYKGGSAFDRCRDLPHVTGVVTDLDDHLAERALRSLQAELRRRERALRSEGLPDLAAYHRAREHDPGLEPLPRLVIVIDEFATLAAELPDFLGALIGTAQRGRSLGVHLVLATQRPSGAVDDRIRANVNLRIALRFVDRADSVDVIDAVDAALLPRSRPGRAVVRLGAGELTTIQTATCSQPSSEAEAVLSARPLDTLVGGESPISSEVPGCDADAALTDLDHIVDATRAAQRAHELAPPRAPWLEPLPDRLSVAAIGPVAPGHIPIGLADDPDHQTRIAIAWAPPRGNLAVVGGPASGVTTALLTIARTAADASSPARLHIYAVDGGGGGLASLTELPHTGAVVSVDDQERLQRLIDRLRTELSRRRSKRPAAADPSIVLLVDRLGSVLAALNDSGDLRVVDGFQQVLVGGAAVSIHAALGADRAGALPPAVAAAASQRLVLDIADPVERAALGVRLPRSQTPVPGRGCWCPLELEVQVALAPVAHSGDATEIAGRPAPIRCLPEIVEKATLTARADVGSERWSLPFGVSARTLDPAFVHLRARDAALVAGPSRSGRSTLLATLGAWAVDAGVEPLSVAPAAPLEEVNRKVDSLLVRGDSWLLLVDDGDELDEQTGASVVRLIEAASPRGRVVVAARPDRVRAAYGSWIRKVADSRIGIALLPDVDLDGDLWRTPLPRRSSLAWRPGRGYLVADGSADLVQVAVT